MGDLLPFVGRDVNGAAAPSNGHEQPRRPGLRMITPLPTPQRLREAWRAAEYRLTVMGWVTCVLWTVEGAGLVFGPDRWVSAPAYDLLRSYLPMRAWGAVFLALAVLHVTFRVLGRPCPAMMLGAMVAAFWAGTFLVQAVDGDLTVWTAAPAWGFIAASQALQNRWMPPRWVPPFRRDG